MKFIPLLLGLSVGVAFGASAADSEPTYDCTTAETKIYIEQVTHAIFAPSSIPTADEYMKAYMESESAKAASGDSDSQSCVSIFSDGKLNEDWKGLVDEVRKFKFEFSFTGINAATIKKVLDKAKETVQEQMTQALEELGEDICSMLDTDELKGMLLDAVNEKYGINSRGLRIEDFKNSLTDKAMSDSPDNIQLLLSEDEFLDEVDKSTVDEIRKARSDLWKNF